jgi:hypothetical protein
MFKLDRYRPQVDIVTQPRATVFTNENKAEVFELHIPVPDLVQPILLRLRPIDTSTESTPGTHL